MILIYRIKNNVNNKIYVGQTSKLLKQRLSQHIHNKSNCKHLRNAITKYGPDNFYIELITICHTQNIADKLETFFIKEYDSIINGYNLRSGGSPNCHSQTDTYCSKNNKRKLVATVGLEPTSP